MSKKIIAGLGVVAGLAVALAPVATFAMDVSDQHTDQLVLTVLPSWYMQKADNPKIAGLCPMIGQKQKKVPSTRRYMTLW